MSTLFKSSWIPSTKYEKNSWESCWAYPEKIGLSLATAAFRLYGLNVDYDEHHIALINLA